MVGAPPMNLLPGVVRARAAGPVIQLPFGEVDAARWYNTVPAGTEVIFGIRPHDLAPAGTGQHRPRFAATVHLTEPLGDVTVLDIEAGGAVLKMALPEEEALAYPPGKELAIELSLADAHLFQRETGRAVS
jgi:multiple sugar transport system ATP-binding protein